MEDRVRERETASYIYIYIFFFFYRKDSRMLFKLFKWIGGLVSKCQVVIDQPFYYSLLLIDL